MKYGIMCALIVSGQFIVYLILIMALR
jgi:hypothetical protein